MKIAVLSGKGGTGKTFISTNMALAVENCSYVDCDVEEPNGFLFLKPRLIEKVPVYVEVPKFDLDKCVGCRACVSFCNFNALAFIKGKPKVFPEVCHSCLGCKLVCQSAAIDFMKRPIGSIEKGLSSTVETYTGILNNDEATGVEIIRKLLKLTADTEKLVIYDCPPGSACSVMESIKTADYCLLVAEPTAFGVQNLSLVTKLAKMFKKPCAIVINKALDDNRLVEDFASRENIDILLKIPFDKEIGSKNSNGEPSVSNKKIKDMFSSLYKRILSNYKESGTK